MKIAVTSTGPELKDTVETRFGRCAYFLIVDPETLAFEAIPNPNISLGGGAGIQSAQLMASKGVSTVLTGNCGPNAFRTFGAAGIHVITGMTGRIRDAVEQFRAGTFTYSSAANVESHFGLGKGRGGLEGKNVEDRRSGKTGKGSIEKRGFPAPGPPPLSNFYGKENIEGLKKTVMELRDQLESIEARISDLKNK